MAAAIIVNGDSGHRVVLCVSDGATSAQNADVSSDGEPSARGTPVGSCINEGVAEQSSWASHVQFHPQNVAGVSAKGIAKLMAPKPALCGHDVQVSFDHLIFLGHPTVLDPKQLGDTTTDAARAHHEALTTFTFVLVVRGGCRAVPKWKEVVQAAGNVWLHEELRCGYLSTQIQRISERTGDGLCTLASEVRNLFDSLRVFGVAHILVNSWLNLHVRVRDSCSHRPRKSDTLLLLQPRETILSEIPADCSLDLALLVQRADPLKTIKELAADMNLPVQRLLHLSQHLERWGKGRLVQTVSRSRMYLLSPTLDLAEAGVLAAPPTSPEMPALLADGDGRDDGGGARAAGQRAGGQQQPAHASTRKKAAHNLPAIAASLDRLMCSGGGDDAETDGDWMIGVGVGHAGGGGGGGGGTGGGGQQAAIHKLLWALTMFSTHRTLEEHLRSIEAATLAQMGVSRWHALEPAHVRKIRQRKSDLSRLAAWLLEKNLVIELHTFVQFSPELVVQHGDSAAALASEATSDHLIVKPKPSRIGVEFTTEDLRDWAAKAATADMRRLRTALVSAWTRSLPQYSLAGRPDIRLSHKGRERLWSRLRRLVGLLDGRHTIQGISEETKLSIQDINSVIQHCADFLYVIRCV